MISTLDDLFKWDRALYTDQLLNETMKTVLYTPQVEEGHGQRYALGLHVSKLDVHGQSKTLIWHTGGGVNLLCRSVEDGHTVILLNNWTIEADLYQIGLEMMKILYGVPYEMQKVSLLGALYTELTEHGIDAAILRYHHIKTNQAAYYNLAEDQLHQLGLWLAGQNHLSEAIAFLKLNRDQYPQSASAWTTLAEVFEKDGKVKEALSCYEEVLSLNRSDTKAQEAIVRLKEKK
jgi:tetratricopeptide (TPR) repeat protein